MVVGRSLTSSVVPTAVWVTIAWANPCIMKGGYLLKSLEVASDGFLCGPCVQAIPEQWIWPRTVPTGIDQSGWWQDRRSCTNLALPASAKWWSICLHLESLSKAWGSLRAFKEAPWEPRALEFQLNDVG